MINGVRTKKLNVLPDERGRLMEIFRCDDDVFKKFGQVYMTSAYPGIIKAWHYHKKQTDNFAVLHGMVKIVLYDARKDSPTFKEVNEFFAGTHNPMLITVPPFVYHGFKCVSDYEALLVNVPTEPYNYKEPDEFRLPFDTKEIPYIWEVRHG
ncbi:MAG: dTDP-4-dehydrorhamnose 3,5-epimerase family protein [Planctomycetes bacterium]|nr:dTDP-4-dehydrorhamnose 3,5-epimerase family protein [Planctomycetota bacterium]